MAIRDKYLYQNVKNKIKNMISEMPAGTKLPSRSDLCREMDVSKITIDRAISELIGQNYLYAVDGSGTFVSEKPSVSTGKTDINSWGLVLPSLKNYVFPELIRGIEEVANENNINLIICNSDDDPSKESNYIEKLILSKVKGLIVVPTSHEEELRINSYTLLKENKIPFLFCLRDINTIDVPKIKSNDFYGSYIATKHLIEHKYKPIAFISQKMYSTIEHRMEGYMSALLEAGIEIDYDYIFQNDNYDEAETANNGVRYFSGLKVFPRAVVCHNDVIAANLLTCLQDRGYKVSEDVAVIGSDDSNICNLLPLRITSVKYPVYEIGKKSGELLLEMTGPDKDMALNKKTNISVLMPELVIRESCGCKPFKKD